MTLLCLYAVRRGMIFKLFSGDHVKFSDLTREKMEEYIHFLRTRYDNKNTLISDFGEI
jgi:hypothetical protein